MAATSKSPEAKPSESLPKPNHQPGSSPPTGEALQRAEPKRDRRSPHASADAFNREPKVSDADKASS
jgi:hypothetical protein